MLKSDAEAKIMAEMRRRLPAIPYEGTDGGFAQFCELEQERPDLLDFRSPAGKWQLVHGWMLKRRLVTR